MAEKLLLQDIERIGPKTAEALKQMGIETYEDLIVADIEDLQSRLSDANITAFVPDFQQRALEKLAEEEGIPLAKLVVHVSAKEDPVANARVRVNLGDKFAYEQPTADYGRANFLVDLSEGSHMFVTCELPDGRQETYEAHSLEDLERIGDMTIYSVSFEDTAKIAEDVLAEDMGREAVIKTSYAPQGHSTTAGETPETIALPEGTGPMGRPDSKHWLIVQVLTSPGLTPVLDAEIKVLLVAQRERGYLQHLTNQYGWAQFDVTNYVPNAIAVECNLPVGHSFDESSVSEQKMLLHEGTNRLFFYAIDQTMDEAGPMTADAFDDTVQRVTREAKDGAESLWRRITQIIASDPVQELGDDVTDYLTSIQTAANDIAVGQGGYGAGGTSGNLDGSPAAKKVDAALAKVLGRPLPVGTSDTATLRTVLSGTFPEDPDTGHILRQPVRTYVTVAAGSGYLAADQSTLSRQVHLIANEARTELDSLRSIATDTDDEEAEALTELIAADLDALIAEAARMDRPREPRVADILDNLDTQVAELVVVLGLNQKDDLRNRKLVTSEEAQLVAGAKLLKSYVANLRTAYTDYFSSPAGKYPLDNSFSGRLAVADMQLAGIANSVADLRQTLANAGLSQVESQTTYIDLGNGSALTLDGILNWIEDVAAVEGPEMIARSGRLGLQRVHTTVKSSLVPLVAIVLKNGQGKNPAHPALRRLSVQHALTELEGQLQQFTAGNPAAV